jgi:hypothetical protein
MAMVLIALLGGGDYAPEGLTGFGKYSAAKFYGTAVADRTQVPQSLPLWPTQDYRTS